MVSQSLKNLFAGIIDWIDLDHLNNLKIFFVPHNHLLIIFFVFSLFYYSQSMVTHSYILSIEYIFF